MHHNILRPATVLSLMLAAFLLMLAVDLLLHETIAQIFEEGHAIEFFSGICYLVAAVLLIVMAPMACLRRQWHLPVILLLMSLREFDLDKCLTSDGILQLRLYSGPAPFAEKIAGGMVVALILICGWRLASRSIQAFWTGLRSLAPESWLVLLAAMALVFAKTLDGLGRKLASFGYALAEQEGIYAARFEEMMELEASMMLVMAVVHGCRRWRVQGLTLPCE